MNSYHASHPIAFIAALVVLPFSATVSSAVSSEDALPLKPQSVRFAVIGDNGTGDKPEYDIAQQMEKFRAKVGFDFVLMLGDNIYGSASPAAMKRKFEDPYKPLLDAGVKFYASLGNHDNPNERFYKPFNMNEKRYYSFKKGNAEFFALDSTYMDPRQMDWLTSALRNSTAAWKICYFHHPLYSDGRFHGADADLRARIEPVFKANGVRLVLSGHDHLYERIRPHDGIYYFVMGSAGKLRAGGLKRSSDTAKGFDTDRTFMMMEISGDELYFQTVARTGETIDSGVIQQQDKPVTSKAAAAAQ